VFLVLKLWQNKQNLVKKSLCNYYPKLSFLAETFEPEL